MNDTLYVIPNNGFILNKHKRKCSFCNCEGHIITSCNNELLVNSNNYLIYLKNNLLLFHNNNRISAIQDFEKHVYDYYTYSDSNKKLLRAIACRFYNTRLRSLLIISINRIILRLFDINIQWLTFHEYNFVPFNENSPIRISYIFQGMLINMTNIMINNMTPEPVYDIKLLTINDTNNNYNTETECSICYNSLKQIDYASFECKHDYCVDCVTQLMFKKHNTCPHCRNNICVISCYNKENYDKLTYSKTLL